MPSSTNAYVSTGPRPLEAFGGLLPVQKKPINLSSYKYILLITSFGSSLGEGREEAGQQLVSYVVSTEMDLA